MDESGQVVPLFVVMLLVLLGIVAISVDGGQSYRLKNKAFNIAEVSALSASGYLMSEADQDIAKDLAIEYALANGAEVGNVDVTTEYNIQSVSGVTTNRITVGITLTQKLGFGAILGKDKKIIYAEHSVAVPSGP